METEKQGGFVMKIILDLDTGIDDALALSYALGDPKAEDARTGLIQALR